MRFVSPETVRLTLKNDEWIEIKKELGKGEKAKYRAAGLGRMVMMGGGQQGLDVDFPALSRARVETYLLEWSARDAKGKAIPVTRDAIDALDDESFDEIDKAIEAHIAALEDEKKTPSGSASLMKASA